jgi:hypothetical protein
VGDQLVMNDSEECSLPLGHPLPEGKGKMLIESHELWRVNRGADELCFRASIAQANERTGTLHNTTLKSTDFSPHFLALPGGFDSGG